MSDFEVGEFVRHKATGEMGFVFRVYPGFIEVTCAGPGETVQFGTAHAMRIWRAEDVERYESKTDEKQMERAQDIAAKASDLVGGDRDRQHGAKHDNFNRIAGMWNAWLAIRKEPAAPLTAHDVGILMALMKLARTQSGAVNLDDYVDACGYSACAGEVAQAESA